MLQPAVAIRPAQHAGPPARVWSVYRVRQGDTLWGIAMRTHTTVRRIASLNAIANPSLIHAGLLLLLPPTGTDQSRRRPAAAAHSQPQRAVQPTTVHRLIAQAKRQLGKPYVWGAAGPNAFDCSGFVQYIAKRAGIHLPRTSYRQFRVGRPVPRWRLSPGDLVFFSTDGPGPSHVGIYLGDGRFIAADTSAGSVVVQRLANPYWSRSYVGARRVVPSGP